MGYQRAVDDDENGLGVHLESAKERHDRSDTLDVELPIGIPEADLHALPGTGAHAEGRALVQADAVHVGRGPTEEPEQEVRGAGGDTEVEPGT